MTEPVVLNLPSLARRVHPAHDGVGTVESVRPLAADTFETDLMFVDYVEIPAGSTIGRHTHGEDEELYFVVEGSGLMNVEGTEHRVGAGDLILNRRGGTHGLANDSENVIRLLVWQVRFRDGS